MTARSKSLLLQARVNLGEALEHGASAVDVVAVALASVRRNRLPSGDDFTDASATCDDLGIPQ